MKNKLLFIVLLLATSSFAQVYVGGGIQTAPGTSNLDYMAELGAEVNTTTLYSDYNFTFHYADILNGTGKTSTLSTAHYYKYFNHFLSGAGATFVANTDGFTQALAYINNSSTSANAFIGYGVLFNKFRSTVTYQLPGKDSLPNQRYFLMNNNIVLTKRLRLTVPLGVNSHVNGLGARVTSTSAGVGLRFVF